MAREVRSRGGSPVAIALYRAQVAMEMEGESPGCPHCDLNTFLQSLRELPLDKCTICWTSSSIPDVQQTAPGVPDVLAHLAHWRGEGN